MKKHAGRAAKGVQRKGVTKRLKAAEGSPDDKRLRKRDNRGFRSPKLVDRLRARRLALEEGVDTLLQAGPFATLSDEARLAIRHRALQQLSSAAGKAEPGKRRSSEPSLPKLSPKALERTKAKLLLSMASQLPVIARTGARVMFTALANIPDGTALVLSGGGSRGSFQTGALRYIDQRVWGAQRFGVICGTSVGAVNAVVIARFGRPGIGRLLKAWRGLDYNESMYRPSKEYEKIDDILREHFDTSIKKLMNESGAPFELELGGWQNLLKATIGGILVTSLPLVGGAIALEILEHEVEKVIQEKLDKLQKIGELIKSAPSIYTLEPLRELFETTMDLHGPWYHPLRLCTTRLQDGKVCYVTEQATLLIGSASDVAPELEDIWELEGDPADAILAGTLASAAVPAMFPAVRLRENVGRWGHFVDGGVRDMYPLRGARELHVAGVLAIGCAPLELAAWEAPSQKPAAIATAPRSLDIGMNEIVRNDFVSPTGQVAIPTSLIVPMSLVHDSFLINQALLRINMEYGYMLAHLHYLGPSMNSGALLLAWLCIEGIVALRKEIVADEIEVARLTRSKLLAELTDLAEAVLGENLPGDEWHLGFQSELLAHIRSRKADVLVFTETLFALLGEDAAGLPMILDDRAFIQQWWQDWEMREYPVGYRTGEGSRPRAVLPGSSPLALLAAPFSDHALWGRLPVIQPGGGVQLEAVAPVMPVSELLG